MVDELEEVEQFEIEVFNAGFAGCKEGLENPIICSKASAAARLANFLFGPLP